MTRHKRAKSILVAPSRDLVLGSRRETESLGSCIGRLLEGGHVLALQGELGVGKTALVRGIMVGLGAPTASVSSPTFTLVHHYPARIPLIHMDWYRLQAAEEAETIGVSEYFTDEVVTAIEWADRFPSLLPRDHVAIQLTHLTPTTRAVRLTARGPRSRLLVTTIKKTWEPIQPSRSSKVLRRTTHKVRQS